MSQLTEYDFIVVADGSGSMGEPVKAREPNGRNRWDYMQESLGFFVREVSKIDSDGIGLVLFNRGEIISKDSLDAAGVRDMLGSTSPRGGTPMAEALTAAFALAGKSDKKDFILVFTDGVPDDRAAVADVIRRHANKQETDDACTVLFVQVGDDAAASAYLKLLDDDLKGAKFDIVDAKTIDEAEKFATVEELVLAAIAD